MSAKNITPHWLTAKRRKRLYRVGGALVAVALAYGIVSAEQAVAWVGVAGAVLLPAIAQDNVDT